MQNTRLDEPQAGIKIAGRNINIFLVYNVAKLPQNLEILTVD